MSWISEEEGLTETPSATRGVQGCLSRRDVVEAMGERIDEVVTCLVEEARGRAVIGRIVLTFTVMPDGSTCGASIGGPTRLRTATERCVLDAVCDWTFSETVEPTVVAYPIFLEGE